MMCKGSAALRIHRQQVYQFLGIDVVVLDDGPHRVPVIFRAHVLVGREIDHDVETLLFAEDGSRPNLCV